MTANNQRSGSIIELNKVYELKPTGFEESFKVPDIQKEIDELLGNDDVAPVEAKSATKSPTKNSDKNPALNPDSITVPAPKHIKRRIFLDYQGNSINNQELKEILEKGYQKGLDLTQADVLNHYLQENASELLLSELAVITAGNFLPKTDNDPSHFAAKNVSFWYRFKRFWQRLFE